MTTAQKRREIARTLSVAGKSDAEVAEILDISVRTIQNYRAKDGAEGNDWDRLRAQKHLEKDGERREYLYSDFVAYMYDSLKEIREDEATPPAEKAKMIVQLSDAFAKMKSIARQEDPELYKRGVIKHVVKTLGKAIRDRGDDRLLEAFIETVDTVQDKLDVAL